MNFGEMTSLIVDDLIDERLTTLQIQNAINAAIDYYGRKTFYFNTSRFSFPTVIGTEYYTLIPSTNVKEIYNIQSVVFVVGTVVQYLHSHLDKDIERLPLNITDTPFAYSYAQMRLRLYPVPISVGTVRVIATYKFADLVNGTDTNDFLDLATNLIRLAAKRYIAYNTLVAKELGDYFDALEIAEAKSLLSETRERKVQEAVPEAAQ